MFTAHYPFIKFLVAFARAVEHEIELQAGQSQIGANLFLIVFREIETEERPDVPLVLNSGPMMIQITK